MASQRLDASRLDHSELTLLSVTVLRSSRCLPRLCTSDRKSALDRAGTCGAAVTALNAAFSTCGSPHLLLFFFLSKACALSMHDSRFSAPPKASLWSGAHSFAIEGHLGKRTRRQSRSHGMSEALVHTYSKSWTRRSCKIQS